MGNIVASSSIEAYFEELEKNTLLAYALAQKARKKGYDPDIKPEVVLAKNLAERVIGLISVVAPQLRESGAIKRIEALEKEFGILDWRVAFQIALEVAQEKFCKFSDKREAMEVGIRVGFAYVTLGAVSAPLEGFTTLEIKQRLDNGAEYFALNFSGPIRAAGGTAAAVCVLIADYVRKKMGYAEYDPQEKEIKRCYSEIGDYHERVTNLQYFPSEAEMDFMVAHMPLEIAGDPSEKFEISNVRLKDIPRIPTNRIRSGYCLMYSSALPLKAPKIWAKLSKWADSFDLGHWRWLDEFLKIQKDMKAREAGSKKEVKKEEVKLKPDYTFIADLVAGRPVFGYPLRNGGFRLRYGRSRTSGYSAQSIHPASMILLNEFIAIATQLKVERPGKAGAYTSCDVIDGPIVKLKDGTVIYVDSEKTAKLVNSEVSEIVYLGDVLINYGDFYDRAHPLIPAGYVQEEWIQELEQACVALFGTLDLDKLGELVDIDTDKLSVLFQKPLTTKISAEAAIHISERMKIPLHPKHIFYWNSILPEDLFRLALWIASKGKSLSDPEVPAFEEDSRVVSEKKLFIEGSDVKRALELIGLEHSPFGSGWLVEEDASVGLLANLGAASIKELELKLPLIRSIIDSEPKLNSLEVINKISKIKIVDKCGTFIGARMGRPEKAKIRKLTSSPHTLFPVGSEGGKYRSIQSALEKGYINAQFTPYFCKACKRESVFSVCEFCDKPAEKFYFCKSQGKLVKPDGSSCEDCKTKVVDGDKPCSPQPYKMMRYDLKAGFPKMLEKIGTHIYPDLIKGVKGTSNKEHTPEHLIKGILRAKHNIYVNKDGTTRYDCSEIPITHFKPKEIGVSVSKLKELGYALDIRGAPLENEEQILEIKPQDVLLPCSPVSPEEPADEVFLRTANYIDELLVKLYGQKPFYNLKSKEDLVGHLAIGLAPHTSAGIMCRIIGFTKTQGFLSHPYIHAAMRRDCDGDESCFLLLMDGLLNFSKKYLPESRGSTMDAPLVLTYILNPTEVDDMIFNMDIVWKYPLTFYQAARQYKKPGEVKLKLVGHVLRTPLQYEKMGFTHDTSDINNGVLCSAYKLLPSMEDKLRSQMELAEKIRAVDSSDVAKLVIDKHFMKDTKGSLRKFSQQEFRCVECNEKFRRPPLCGKCTQCGGKLLFTVSEGSVVKYLEMSMTLAEKYHVPKYMKQSLELLKARVESVFGREKERQEGLSAFFSA